MDQQNPPKHVWDPFGEKINESIFAVDNAALHQEFQQYVKNPGSLKKKMLLFSLIPLMVIVLLTLVPDLMMSRFGLTIIVLSCFFPALYFLKIKKLEDQLVLFLLCNRKNWVYNPSSFKERYELSKLSFPEIFSTGKRQSISNEIWGQLKPDDTPFYRCTFTYTTGSGKSSTTHHNAVFILKMDGKIPESFVVERQQFFNQRGGKITTESQEFNKLFSVEPINQDTYEKSDIIRVLSPSVLVRLIDLAKKFKINWVLFKESSMVIVFDEEVWDAVNTNFFIKVEIDPRDEQYFYEVLYEAVAIPNEMREYIR